MNKTKTTVFLLLLIIILAAGVRFYKLTDVPPSLSWDEVTVGYNAWTIANFGKDEWGRTFPLFFKSFEDDKQPVHIYLTALSTKVLGLSEFSTRFPSSLFGVLNVVLIFFLAEQLFKSRLVGVVAALVLAISPINIHFSHFNHELNFAVFFFMLGLYLFLKGLEKKNYFLILSVVSFAISFLSYHSAKVVVPIMVGLLVLLYLRKLKEIGPLALWCLLILLTFSLLAIKNPELLGGARIKQTGFSEDRIEKTMLYQKTQNELLGRVEIAVSQYPYHFTKEFLFLSGDKNPRLSPQVTGEFYKVDALFLILGALTLLIMRSKTTIILLSWALLAPIPSSLAAEAPHAARSMFMTGSWHLIIALGIVTLLQVAKIRQLRIIVLTVVTVTYAVFATNFLSYYYENYSKRYAIEWQYGMKEIAEYVKDRSGYVQVYITDIRSQPYIFLLYYLKTPLADFLSSVSYNESKSRSYNLVASFDRYYLGGWDTVESMPTPGVLYVLTPSEYDGLRHKNVFNVKELIRYPNGTEAFYLVSLY